MRPIIGVTVGTPTSATKIENEIKPVLYIAQTLTEGEKTQARANIGAASEEEVEELKTSVGEGKALIASAVTDKGVQTADDASFQTIAENVSKIQAGAYLPELTNEGTSADLMEGKEMINSKGEKVGGTFTLNSELTEQDELIAEIKSVLQNKAAGGGDGGNKIDEMLDNTLVELNSNATAVKPYTFRGSTALTTVNLPNATSIGTYAFYQCSGITNFEAKKVTSIGTYAFYGCSSLTEVNFPLATSVPSSCFYQATSLAKADFGVAKSIAANAFSYCSKLKTLILRRSDAITTLNSSSFSGITFSGYIYVPSALIETYKTASNWSSYSTKFRAIEDYPNI